MDLDLRGRRALDGRSRGIGRVVIAGRDHKLIDYLRVARAAAPHLVAGGWGRIINISGLAARQTGTIHRRLPDPCP